MPRYKRTVDLGEQFTDDVQHLQQALPEGWQLEFRIKHKKRPGKADRDYWAAWYQDGPDIEDRVFYSSIRFQDVLTKAWLYELELYE